MASRLALVLLLAAAARPARAQGDDETAAEGRVKVAAFVLADKPLENARHAQLLRGIEKGLRENARIDVRDKDLLYADFAGETPTDAVQEARAFLKIGRELLGQDRAHDALLKLAAADSALENVLAFVKKSELADAQFLRGVAEVKTGDKKAARATFARLIVWRPDYVVDVERFPGSLPVWEEARRVVKRGGVGALQITSEPEGAMAFVDGRYVGPTPVTAGNLAAGEHYVTLKVEGFKRRLIKATVDPKYDELVSETLPKSEKYHLIAELLAKVRADAGKDPPSQALVDLSGFLGLDQVVVLKVKREGSGARVDGWLYDLRSKKRLSQVTGAKVPADAAGAEQKLDELAKNLYLGVRYDGRSDADLAAATQNSRKPPPKPKPSGPALYTKWWFWTIVGGVVVAGSAPFIYGALSDDGPSCPGGYACTELDWDF